MNPVMREYFRQRLLGWKDELNRETTETIRTLQEESSKAADIADRAALEADRALNLRTRDRGRKLASKIDAALRRIEDGSYGYCEETTEPISLERLEARPVATLSLAAQERHETTVDNITTKLRDSYQVAKDDKNSNAMTAAAMGEAKLHGLLIDRSKVETSNYSDMTPEQLTEQQREIENDFIRQGGRDYLVQESARWQDILVLWDAGQFERYAAGEAKPITH